MKGGNEALARPLRPRKRDGRSPERPTVTE